MDLTYLDNIITHLTPLINTMLPVIGTGLVLGRLYKVITK